MNPRQSRHYYYLVVLSVLLAVFMWWILFGPAWNDLSSGDSQELHMYLSLGIAGLLTVDVGLILLRFSYYSMIDPGHLQLFPISKRQTALYYLVSLLIDHKAFVYLATILACAVLLFRLQMYEGIFLWSLVLIVCYIITSVWIVALYFLTINYFRSSRQKLLSILYAVFFLCFIVELGGFEEAYLYFPFVNFVSTGLLAVIQADYYLLAKELGYLLLTLVAGVLVLFAAMRTVEPRPAS